jgi:ketosteroid isomerase-like protein
MLNPRLWLLLVALAATNACTRTSFDAEAEQQKLLRRDAEWAEASAAGKDIDRIVSYWSDDAVVIEPGQPVYNGKAAIRGLVASSLQTPGFKIHWVSETPELSPDGRMAYMQSATEMTVHGANGSLVTLHMHGITVWRRGSDGEWLCVADIANELPPAVPPKQ